MTFWSKSMHARSLAFRPNCDCKSLSSIIRPKEWDNWFTSSLSTTIPHSYCLKYQHTKESSGAWTKTGLATDKYSPILPGEAVLITSEIVVLKARGKNRIVACLNIFRDFGRINASVMNDHGAWNTLPLQFWFRLSYIKMQFNIWSVYFFNRGYKVLKSIIVRVIYSPA